MALITPAEALVGELVEVYDDNTLWYASTIKKRRGEGDALKVRVHFRGWNNKHEKWFLLAAGVIRWRDPAYNFEREKAAEVSRRRRL